MCQLFYREKYDQSNVLCIFRTEGIFFFIILIWTSKKYYLELYVYYNIIMWLSTWTWSLFFVNIVYLYVHEVFVFKRIIHMTQRLVIVVSPKERSNSVPTRYYYKI